MYVVGFDIEIDGLVRFVVEVITFVVFEQFSSVGSPRARTECSSGTVER